MNASREVTIEKKGGVTTPLRLFAVAWEIKGLERKQIAETEVEIIDGVITRKQTAQNEDSVYERGKRES